MPTKNFHPLPVEQCRRKDANTYVNSEGYVIEYCPEHPQAGPHNRGFFHQHRLVVEEYLGRVLEPDEVIHHCDEIRNHNAPENLELQLSGKHIQSHMKNVHREKPLNDPYYINWVRQAAQNPNVGKREFLQRFPYSLSTVDRILAKYNIRWHSKSQLNLDPEHVERVLSEFQRQEALEILGCSVQYLWNTFPELMRKTANRKLKSYQDRNPK